MERNRLHWRCRRGMLELDLLLQGFLERGYDRLDEPGRAVFIRLLARPDQELLEYLLCTCEPDDRELADVIAHIRRTAGP